jgi:hypothetical protein
MALELLNGVVVPDTPTLHRHTGEKFFGDCAVQELLIDYDRRNPEIIFLADGTRAFSQIGDPQRWIDGFTIYVFRRVAMQQIKNIIADEVTEGIFQLLVPGINGSATETLNIRFFDAPFAPVSPRRANYPEIFSAQITEVDVY